MIVEHQAHTCEHCHASIPEDTPVIDQETRQEIEIEIRRVVREHRCGIVCVPTAASAQKAPFHRMSITICSMDLRIKC